MHMSIAETRHEHPAGKIDTVRGCIGLCDLADLSDAATLHEEVGFTGDGACNHIEDHGIRQQNGLWHWDLRYFTRWT